jgi:hypothetical protein
LEVLFPSIRSPHLRVERSPIDRRARRERE